MTGNAPTSAQTVTQYAIRYTVMARRNGRGQLKPTTRYRPCGRADAAMVLAEVSAWQEDNQLCPRVDAAIVTRTITYSPWTTPPPRGRSRFPARRDRHTDLPDPDAAYKQHLELELDLPGGSS